jgi:O-acetylserine/cysteine efflux transporter
MVLKGPSPQAGAMPLRDRLLALAVAVIWGLNFPAIHLSLAQFPPFLLVALRFALIAVPTLLLVPRPAVPWRWVLGYGAGFGVLQFLFLYLAMDTGMPTGLASLVLQSSAPFTVVLAGVLLHERLSARQLAGVGLAVAGLGGIALHRAGLGGGATLLPVVLTLCGGLGWALGNLCNRQARTDEPFRLMLWMTVVPPLPMLAVSLLVEGPEAIATSLTTLGSARGALALGGLAFTVVVATVVGSGIWTWLMSRHPSSTVAPFSMLVPVVGIGASWLAFDEPVYAVELLCGAVVVAGVLLGSGGGRGRPSRPAARVAGLRPVRLTVQARRPPDLEEPMPGPLPAGRRTGHPS